MYRKRALLLSNKGCTYWSRTTARHIPIHTCRYRERYKYRGGNRRNRLECNGCRLWFACSLCSILLRVFVSPVPVRNTRNTYYKRQSLCFLRSTSIVKTLAKQSNLSLSLSFFSPNQISLKFRKWISWKIAHLFLVNRPVDNFVFGASRWETEAPRVLSHGIRFLLGYFHRYRVSKKIIEQNSIEFPNRCENSTCRANIRYGRTERAYSHSVNELINYSRWNTILTFLAGCICSVLREPPLLPR